MQSTYQFLALIAAARPGAVSEHTDTIRAIAGQQVAITQVVDTSMFDRVTDDTAVVASVCSAKNKRVRIVDQSARIHDLIPAKMVLQPAPSKQAVVVRPPSRAAMIITTLGITIVSALLMMYTVSMSSCSNSDLGECRNFNSNPQCRTTK